MLEISTAIAVTGSMIYFLGMAVGIFEPGEVKPREKISFDVSEAIRDLNNSWNNKD